MLEKLKMTTPIKVKTASPSQRQPKRQESPRKLNLKRLNQHTLKPAKPGTNLYLQKANESQRNVNSLLSRWEKLSNKTLTSAVQTIPKLKPKTDGQSRDENNF